MFVKAGQKTIQLPNYSRITSIMSIDTSGMCRMIGVTRSFQAIHGYSDKLKGIPAWAVIDGKALHLYPIPSTDIEIKITFMPPEEVI